MSRHLFAMAFSIDQAAVVFLLKVTVMAGMPKRLGYKLRAIGGIARAAPRILRE